VAVVVAQGNLIVATAAQAVQAVAVLLSFPIQQILQLLLALV
jgi:hypothetical protein